MSNWMNWGAFSLYLIPLVWALVMAGIVVGCVFARRAGRNTRWWYVFAVVWCIPPAIYFGYFVFCLTSL